MAQAPSSIANNPEEETEKAEKLVPRVPGEIEAFSPRPRSRTSPSRPGLTEGIDWESMVADPTRQDLSGRLKPERTFVNRIRGEIIEGPRRTRIFVPRLDSEDKLGRPVLVLPCGVLERFDEFLMQKSDRAPVIISGRLYLYGDRNYLLPSSILAASHVPVERSVASEDRTGVLSTEDSGDQTPVSSAEDEIEALIGELERQPVYTRSRSSRGSTVEPATDQSDEAASAGGLSTAERYVSSLRGRVVRSSEGMWLFSPDNDGEAKPNRAMTLLPCRLLQSLENYALREGDASAVELSGRVYSYQGAQYILPTLYQRERRIGVDPLQ